MDLEDQELLDHPELFSFEKLSEILEKTTADFETDLSIAYPVSDVLNISKEILNNSTNKSKKVDTKWKVLVSFLSLGGGCGPLPFKDTRNAIQQKNQKKPGKVGFYNLFSNIWIQILVTIKNITRIEKVAPYLACFSGALWFDNKLKPGYFPTSFLSYYTCDLFQSKKSVYSVQQILTSYFNVPIYIVALTGFWKNLEENQYTKLGENCCILGENTVLGKKVWVEQMKLVFKIQTRTYVEYRKFLPFGDYYSILKQMVLWLLGQEYTFEICLEIPSKELPSLTLDAEKGSYLDWDTYFSKSNEDSNKIFSTSFQFFH